MEAYETDNASVSISQRSQYDLPVTCEFQLVSQKRRKGLSKIKLLHNENLLDRLFLKRNQLNIQQMLSKIMNIY